MTHTEHIKRLCEGLRVQCLGNTADEIIAAHCAAMNEMAEKIAQARAGRAASAETAKSDSPTCSARQATVGANTEA